MNKVRLADIPPEQFNDYYMEVLYDNAHKTLVAFEVALQNHDYSKCCELLAELQAEINEINMAGDLWPVID